MPYKYKINVLDALKDKGYSQYRIRKDKIFGQEVINKFRTGDTNINMHTLELLCDILDCKPSDIIDF